MRAIPCSSSSRDGASRRKCMRRRDGYIRTSCAGGNVNMHTRRSAALVFASLVIACGGGKGGGTDTVAGRRARGDTVTIALIGKSASNPVFLAARNGAEAAARDL